MNNTKVTMRTPFPAHCVSKKPKPSKAQTDEAKNNPGSCFNCPVCGGWHHKRAIHLDYVGHAALTDRMLDVDPSWSWEPLSIGTNGLPVLDSDGGLWIKLTINGVTRLGYGDSPGKTGGDAMKEKIGDALRNAAMRFGAALELWHKGDLHVAEKENDEPEIPASVAPVEVPKYEALIWACETIEELSDLWRTIPKEAQLTCVIAKNERKTQLEKLLATEDVNQ